MALGWKDRSIGEEWQPGGSTRSADRGCGSTADPAEDRRGGSLRLALVVSSSLVGALLRGGSLVAVALSSLPLQRLLDEDDAEPASDEGGDRPDR